MKIAVISSWPPRMSGLSFYSMKLYTAMTNLSNKVHIVIIGNIDSETKHSCNNLMVEKVWRDDWLAPFKCLKACLKAKADIYHVQHEYMLFRNPVASLSVPVLIPLLRIFAARPVIVTMHGVISKKFINRLTDVETDNLYITLFQRIGLLKILYIIMILVLKAICFFSSKVIVHSRFAKYVLVEEYCVEENKVLVVPHGVDKHAYKRNFKSGKTILFLGFIRPSKGLEYLINAFSLILKELRGVDVKLIIAGDSPFRRKTDHYAEMLKRMIYELDIQDRVILLNRRLSEDEVLSLIQCSDIIVLPYLDYFVEASGILCRVMDYGKPVICTKTPRFISELVNYEDCIMVRPRDVVDLAWAIHKLLNDEEFGKRLGENLRKKAYSRYWETVAKEHLKLYGGLLKK